MRSKNIVPLEDARRLRQRDIAFEDLLIAANRVPSSAGFLRACNWIIVVAVVTIGSGFILLR